MRNHLSEARQGIVVTVATGAGRVVAGGSNRARSRGYRRAGRVCNDNFLLRGRTPKSRIASSSQCSFTVGHVPVTEVLTWLGRGSRRTRQPSSSPRRASRRAARRRRPWRQMAVRFRTKKTLASKEAKVWTRAGARRRNPWRQMAVRVWTLAGRPRSWRSRPGHPVARRARAGRGKPSRHMTGRFRGAGPASPTRRPTCPTLALSPENLA
jgi:hypothetical protein